MKKLSIVAFVTALIAAFGVVQAGTSSAANSCINTTITTNVNGPLDIPAGSTCTLTGPLTITGAVTIGSGASVTAKDVTVKGSVSATNPALIDISGKNKVAGSVTLDGAKDIKIACGGDLLQVGGNVTVKNGPSTGTFTPTGTTFPCLIIGGSVTLAKNKYPSVGLALAKVSGSVNVTDNTGTVTITANSIKGSLNCSGNTSTLAGAGTNSISGAKTGQCSAF